MSKRTWLLGLIVSLLTVMPAEAGFWHRSKACEPDSVYSRWNFWAPALVRWKNRPLADTFSGHAPDHYPCVPNFITVVPYPCPAVPPEARYLYSGLPYDASGPFMAPAIVVPIQHTE